MTHHNKTTEELFERFKTVSRQAICDLRKRHINNQEMVERIDAAKKLLKLWKRGGVPPRSENVRLYRAWQSMRNKMYEGLVNICDEFDKFEDFLQWCEGQKGCYEYVTAPEFTWEFHNSIFDEECKSYDKETCVFVPRKVARLINMDRSTQETLTGVKGVTFNKVNNSYVVQGFNKYIGSYSSLSQAEKVYAEHRQKYVKEYINEFRDVVDPRVLAEIESLL